MSQQDNPTTWWHSDKPARHILRYEDGSEVELSESDLDAMMRRWDRVVREMASVPARQLTEEEPSVLSVSQIDRAAERRRYQQLNRLMERARQTQGDLDKADTNGKLAPSVISPTCSLCPLSEPDACDAPGLESRTTPDEQTSQQKTRLKPLRPFRRHSREDVQPSESNDC